MNTNHFDHVIANYISNFAVMNNERNDETYKWRIAKEFRPMMDAALSAPDAELPKLLYGLYSLTKNLIDSTTLPIKGLSYFSRYEPSAVREMFLNLYADDGNDLAIRMKKINTFLDAEEKLREKYAPNSWKFRNTVHSVTCYQTFYDPDNNYILKPNNCREFANCIEFYDDWRAGANTRLDIFYRMCDQIAAYLENNVDLMAVHNSRYSLFPADTLHSDAKHHILVFDFIFCCSTPAYGLYQGITFNPVPDTKKRAYRDEQRKKAETAKQKLQKARNEVDQLDFIRDCLNKVFARGVAVTSKKYGSGIISDTFTDPQYTIVTIDFPEAGKQRMNLMVSLANNQLSTDNEEVNGFIQKNMSLIKRTGNGHIAPNIVFNNLLNAEKEYEQYEEFLD